MVILGNDKCRLAELREAVAAQPAPYSLRLHPNKAHISRVRDGRGLRVSMSPLPGLAGIGSAK